MISKIKFIIRIPLKQLKTINLIDIIVVVTYEDVCSHIFTSLLRAKLFIRKCFFSFVPYCYRSDWLC